MLDRSSLIASVCVYINDIIVYVAVVQQNTIKSISHLILNP